MTIPLISGSTVKIPSPLANVIVDYVLGEAKIPQFDFAPVINIKELASEFSGIRGALRIADTGDAHLSIENRFAKLGQIGDGSVQFELEDHSKISAKYAFVTGTHVNFSVDSPSKYSTEIQLSEWHWATNETPIAWVGILHGVDFNSSNLLIRGHGGDSYDSLRLQGNAIWHLACKGAFGKHTCLAIVATTSRDCRGLALWDDFSALEFVFGRPLRLNVLIGVNRNNVPVAAFGASFGYRFRLDAINSSPLGNDPRAPWMAVAFPRVVKALADIEPNPVRTAVCGYVDSTVGHLDGQYLFAQVTLETLASRLTPNKKPLVRNVENWEMWARSIRDTLKEHASEDDELALNALAVKLKQLCRPTTSSLVRQVLRRMSIEPPAEALEEIGRRDEVVHTMSMTGGKPYDIERELRRIRIVRTLIAAIVLRHVGYEGALAAWELDSRRWPMLAEWFTVSESARTEARVAYEASSGIDGEVVA